MVKGIQEDIKNLSPYANEVIYIDTALWTAMSPGTRETLNRQAEKANVTIRID